MDEKKTCTCGGTHEHHNHDHTEHHAHECGCSHEHHEGHNCDCAHEHHHGDHEHHEHHHDHACSCEHDHAPHHDSCTCEHGHEHHHEHSHGSCGCGCGHDHSHGPELPKWCMPLAIALFVLGAIAVHTLPVPAWVSGILFAAVILLAGVGVLIDGAKNLFKLNFTENVLMSVAVVAAFCMGEFVEAAAVAVLFNIGEQAEGIAEMRSRRSIEALTQMRPDTARVLRSGEEVTVDPSAVKPGEIIIVNPFERIPLDGEIVYGSSYIDNAALTGESMPVEVSIGDQVLSGGVNGGAKLAVKTTRAFEDSTASRILRMIEESSARKSSAEKLITRFARVYTPIVLVLAILVAVIPTVFGLGEFSTWLYRALTMLVASCPCALVISVPLGFFAGIGVASKNGILIKGGKYLEALAKTDTVVLDKTGTVTTGELSVASVWSAEGIGEQDLLKIAAAAEARSVHPVAKAICAAASEAPEADEIEEIAGRGICAKVGAHTILVGRTDFLDENGIDVSHVPACTVAVAVNDRYIGAITLSDTVKSDSAAAIKALPALGVKRVVMLTGDNTEAAKSAAEQVGITEYRAGLLPQDKAAIVEYMEGVRVFVGDGVNDAPVLSASDCGVAIGLGSEAAIETADAVLSNGSLSLLPRAIGLSKRCMSVIRFNIVFALAVKAAVLICTPLGFVPMWMGVFADVGVMALTVLNTMRILKFKVK